MSARIHISTAGDDTYQAFVLTGIPGIDQIEVIASVDENGTSTDAALKRARDIANQLAHTLRTGAIT